MSTGPFSSTRSSRPALAAFALALVALPASAASPSAPKLFVLDFDGDPAIAAQVSVAERDVLEELQRTRRYDVVSVASSSTVEVDTEQQQQAATMLGAAYVVVGHVTLANGGWTVEVALLDAKTSAKQAGGSANGPAIDGLGRDAVRSMLGEPEAPSSPSSPAFVALGSSAIALGVTGVVGLVPLFSWLSADERFDAAGARLEQGEDTIVELAAARADLVKARNDWHGWGLPLVAGGAVLVAGGTGLILAGSLGE